MDAHDINQIANLFNVTSPMEGHETVFEIETSAMLIEVHRDERTFKGMPYWIRVTGSGIYEVTDRRGWVTIRADEFNKIVDIQSLNFELIIMLEDIERVHTGQL